jgi:hypothetical protein
MNGKPMDQATFDRETAVNQAAYERLRDKIQRDYAGQYVALGQGKILAAAPTYDDAMAAVQDLQPVPEYFLVFPADEEPCFVPYDSF